jgi:hypothetical protein
LESKWRETDNQFFTERSFPREAYQNEDEFNDRSDDDTTETVEEEVTTHVNYLFSLHELALSALWWVSGQTVISCPDQKNVFLFLATLI